jgi:leucyl/phenylalanyl-tRNA--protein transferase
MILERYPKGLFPMANGGPGGPLTWHRPKKRAVIPLDRFHVSRSLTHTLKQARFTVTFDENFEAVLDACADRGEETWIDERIKRVFTELHRQGHAHSVEVWVDNQLAGGLYGVQINRVFCAESKFHRVRDMSKVALAHLAFRLRDRGFSHIEVQYLTPHLAQFGAIEIPHSGYIRILGDGAGLLQLR